MSRIRLSGEVPVYLRMCSQSVTPIRRLAMQKVGRTFGRITEDAIWDVFEENSRYFHIYNLSSRPLGNEEVVYAYLVALPPEFSQEILSRYERNGYLERSDVEEVYRSLVD